MFIHELDLLVHDQPYKETHAITRAKRLKTALTIKLTNSGVMNLTVLAINYNTCNNVCA